MAKVTFDIPDDLLQEFKEVLVAQRKKMAPLLRDAVSAYVRSARSGHATAFGGPSQPLSSTSRRAIDGFKNAALAQLSTQDEANAEDERSQED